MSSDSRTKTKRIHALHPIRGRQQLGALPTVDFIGKTKRDARRAFDGPLASSARLHRPARTTRTRSAVGILNFSIANRNVYYLRFPRRSNWRARCTIEPMLMHAPGINAQHHQHTDDRIREPQRVIRPSRSQAIGRALHVTTFRCTSIPQSQTIHASSCCAITTRLQAQSDALIRGIFLLHQDSGSRIPPVAAHGNSTDSMQSMCRSHANPASARSHHNPITQFSHFHHIAPKLYFPRHDTIKAPTLRRQRPAEYWFRCSPPTSVLFRALRFTEKPPKRSNGPRDGMFSRTLEGRYCGCCVRVLWKRG